MTVTRSLGWTAEPLPDALALPVLDGGRDLLTLVDEADFWWLAHFGLTRAGRYVAVNVSGSGCLLLHRLIACAPRGIDVDHKNGNALDNRRANLRLCTRRQNSLNRVKPTGARGKAPSSRFKGVDFCLFSKRWRARIKCYGATTQLGRFASESDAALAYDAAARRLFGEFAALNFPTSDEGLALRAAA